MSTEKYPVPEAVANSKVNIEQYQEMYRQSIENPEIFWNEQANRLDWFQKWDKTFENDYHKAHIKWFLNGKLNVAYNCIDRHLEKRSDKVAIIWEDDSGKAGKTFTYKELHREVCRFANVLKKNGIKKGDRVAIYMGMIPELAFAMLACARIGAVHSIIFGGFSQEAIRSRVNDAQCKMVITADGGYRGSKIVKLKDTVDQGLSGEGTECVKHVLVVKRTGETVNMKPGRDLYYHDEASQVNDNSEPEIMDSEDPLFILYTSGSTGKPKGVLHTQGGYLVYTSLTHEYVFNLRDDDVYFCAADVGWITGHSYIVYGPLANGATTVMFESIPTYPDAGRYWQMVEKYKINILYTAPTAIRALAKEGDDFVNRYDTSTLRILGTVGEPINRDAWLWYYNVVGKKKAAIVDTWWQTETGGHLITPVPSAVETKPGSATLPFFGIQPCVVDREGKELSGSCEGRLCIKHSWPGQMRTIYGDHERFKKTYFSDFPGLYFSGDGCRRDEEGYYWITGRVDDVLNVSGHRFGTAELEENIVASGIVAECAIVGRPHDVKGESICAYVIFKNPTSEIDEDVIIAEIKKHVRATIGAVAQPDIIVPVSGLPKTRSGKIMRRILRKIASGEEKEFGDITTLADPGVVVEILKSFQRKAK